jgi:phenylacetate-coenzyme A ligase PaaK-like adenylate-forming protein
MEKSKGLGDTVEKITTITGIKPLIEYITADVLKVKNKDCGCGKRKEKLNKVFPYKK